MKNINLKKELVRDAHFCGFSLRSKTKMAGFSFVEVLISVFLVAIGMIAIISLISSTLSNSIDSRSQVIATLLAQEGTELVRNIRDNNWVVYSDPTDHSFENIINNTDCTIDYVNPTINYGPTSHALKINSEGFYAHSGVVNTKFQRKIIIADSGADKSVGSMVIWNGNSFPAVSACNTSSKCAYAQSTLSTYGE